MEKKNIELYQKMLAEQARYRQLLLTMAPQQILEQAEEYSRREDILVSLEHQNLTIGQASALLKSETPLADIFRKWESVTNGYMDNIWDAVTSAADDATQQESGTAGVDDVDLLEAVQNPDLHKAKRLIREFCYHEYGADHEPDFSDLEKIDIAFTNTEDEMLEIQVQADLVNCRINTFLIGTVEGKSKEFLVEMQQYSSLADMNNSALNMLRFDSLVSIEEYSWEAFSRSKNGLEWLKANFPRNTRIKLVEMDDPQAPPKGTMGRVSFIDAIGNIHMVWDSGSSLALCYGIDVFSIKQKEEVQA